MPRIVHEHTRVATNGPATSAATRKPPATSTATLPANCVYDMGRNARLWKAQQRDGDRMRNVPLSLYHSLRTCIMRYLAGSRPWQPFCLNSPTISALIHQRTSPSYSNNSTPSMLASLLLQQKRRHHFPSTLAIARNLLLTPRSLAMRSLWGSAVNKIPSFCATTNTMVTTSVTFSNCV